MTRHAWLSATEGALIIGDPGRDHLTLTADGLQPHRIEGQEGTIVADDQWVWGDVSRIEVASPTSRSSRPGVWAFLRSAAQEAIGFGSSLASAQVSARVHLADGTSALVSCDGHPGVGYPSDDQRAASQVIDAVVDDSALQARLAEDAPGLLV